jgi:hypothetical protein
MSITYPKQFINGETLTHIDLNAQFNTVSNAVAAASGIASLDSSTLVVEDPANATATKAAGKICKWGTSEAFQCSALTATTIAGTTGTFSGAVSGTTITGSSTVQGTQVVATIATGTAPLVVTSTTEVANLKAATATTATQVTDGTNNINPKILSIGDWDMNTTASVNVAHGLTVGNIRTISVSIRSDDTTALHKLPESNLLSDGTGGTDIHADFYLLGSDIVIYRKTSGKFDTAGYDSTSFNRGWVTITYVV